MRARLSAGVWATVAGAAAGTSLLLVARPADPGRQTPIDGFARAHVAAQHEVERRIARFPSTRRLEADHRFLTAEPHIAGSPRDRLLAEWTRDQWIAAGLDSVEIVEHDVLLPYPRDASIEMVGPDPWHATLREHTGEPLAFHAYGASGNVTAPVVAAGTGTPGDFDRLASRGVDLRGKIVLVRYSVPYSYRGYKVYLAEQRGAAAILMYADPADAGTARGPAYPAPDSAGRRRLHHRSDGQRGRVRAAERRRSRGGGRHVRPYDPRPLRQWSATVRVVGRQRWKSS